MAARPLATSILKSLRTSGSCVQRRCAHGKAYFVAQGEQAHPICGFYQAQLDYRPPFAKETPQSSFPPAVEAKNVESPKNETKASATTKKSTSAAKKSTKKAESEMVQSSSKSFETSPLSVSKAPAPSIVFGSRLNAVDPVARKERLDALRRASTRIMGVLVPPKPEEPDNCCMSGCVNCVWDTYREELETWSDATKEVEKRRAAKAQKEWRRKHLAASRAVEESRSVDDDGGGSEANRDGVGTLASKNMWDEELYKNLPVGIREFIKLEKRLRKDETQPS